MLNYPLQQAIYFLANKLLCGFFLMRTVGEWGGFEHSQEILVVQGT